MMHWWQALFDGSYIQVKANLAFIDKYSLYYHGQNCLHVVCIGGNTTNHVKIIQMILKKDLAPDINTPDDFGNTPLHMSACRGYLTMTKVLFLNGADPTLINSQGRTPLKLSYKFKKVEDFIKKWIIFHGWKTWLNELKKQRETYYLSIIWLRNNITYPLCEFLKYI